MKMILRAAPAMLFLFTLLLTTPVLKGGEEDRDRFTVEDARLFHSAFKDDFARRPKISAVGPRIFRVDELDGTMGVIFDGRRATFKGSIYHAAFYVNVPSAETLNIENFVPPTDVNKDLPVWPRLKARLLIVRQDAGQPLKVLLNQPDPSNDNEVYFPESAEIKHDDDFGFIVFDGESVHRNEFKLNFKRHFQIYRIDDSQGKDLNPLPPFLQAALTYSKGNATGDFVMQSYFLRGQDKTWSFEHYDSRNNWANIYGFQGRKFLYLEKIIPNKYQKDPHPHVIESFSFEPDLMRLKMPARVVRLDEAPVRGAKVAARYYRKDNVGSYIAGYLDFVAEWNRYANANRQYLVLNYPAETLYLIFTEERSAVTDAEGRFPLDGLGSHVALRIEAKGFERFEEVYRDIDISFRDGKVYHHAAELPPTRKK